ncbi:hypothetical protein GCM10028857_03310 [Salinarchaeum chitinilyticum]
MQRRSFLTTLGAHSLTPSTAIMTQFGPPPLPREEDCGFWWRYFEHAIALGDSKYCTERFLDTAVKRSNLDNTTDDEAKRVLRAAYRGEYDESVIPAEYRYNP